MQGEKLNKIGGSKTNLQRQILEFCRHIAGSSKIEAIGLLGNYPIGTSNVKATLEVILVIRNFQPRLMSYVKIIGRRTGARTAR